MPRIPAEYVPPLNPDGGSVFDIVCLSLMLLAMLVFFTWMAIRRK